MAAKAVVGTNRTFAAATANVSSPANCGHENLLGFSDYRHRSVDLLEFIEHTVSRFAGEIPSVSATTTSNCCGFKRIAHCKALLSLQAVFANLAYKLRRKSIIAVLTSGARSCWVQ